MNVVEQMRQFHDACLQTLVELSTADDQTILKILERIDEASDHLKQAQLQSSAGNHSKLSSEEMRELKQYAQKIQNMLKTLIEHLAKEKDQVIRQLQHAQPQGNRFSQADSYQSSIKVST